MDVDPGKKVYIGNLDQHVTPQELQEMFQKYGTIQGVWVARSPPGFAFVTFEDKRDAEDATRDLDGAQISGRRIRVEIARGSRGGGGREDKRGGGGGFNGRKMRGGGGGGGRSRSRSVDRGPRRRSPSYGRAPPRDHDRDYERDRSRDRDYDRDQRDRRRRESSRSRSRPRSPFRY